MEPFLKIFYHYREFLNLSPKQMELLFSKIPGDPVFQQLGQILNHLQLENDYLVFLSELKKMKEENLANKSLIQIINHPELIGFLNRQDWQSIFQQMQKNLDESIKKLEQEIETNQKDVTQKAKEIQKDQKIFEQPAIKPHFATLQKHAYAVKELTQLTLDKMKIPSGIVSQKSDEERLKDHLHYWRETGGYAEKFSEVCTNQIAQRSVVKPSLWKRFVYAVTEALASPLGRNGLYHEEVSAYQNAQKEIQLLIEVEHASETLNKHLPEPFYQDFRVQEQINHMIVKNDASLSSLKSLNAIAKTLNVAEIKTENFSAGQDDSREDRDTEGPKKV